jgi:hypothetical protein
MLIVQAKILMDYSFSIAPTVLNAGTMTGLQDFGHGNITELMGYFFAVVSQKIAGMRKSDKSNNVAHCLNGSSLNLGEAAMGTICLVIENKAKQNNHEGIELQSEQFFQDFELTKQEIEILALKP